MGGEGRWGEGGPGQVNGGGVDQVRDQVTYCNMQTLNNCIIIK